eukprot:6211293-Pleurochrysis_carterae.AAC.1
MAHRFQHSTFVLNYGTELPADIQRVRREYPNSYLLHRSGFSALSRVDLVRYFSSLNSSKEDTTRGGLNLHISQNAHVAHTDDRSHPARFPLPAQYRRQTSAKAMAPSQTPLETMPPSGKHAMLLKP